MKRVAGIACAALLSLGLFALADGEEAAPDLSGTWKLSGWNPGTARDGKPDYTGSVKLEAKGKGSYVISWTVNDKVVNTGVGIWDSRTKAFAAGYAVGGKPGAAVFRLSEDKKVLDCVGVYMGKMGEIGHEEFRKE